MKGYRRLGRRMRERKRVKEREKDEIVLIICFH